MSNKDQDIFSNTLDQGNSVEYSVFELREESKDDERRQAIDDIK